MKTLDTIGTKERPSEFLSALHELMQEYPDPSPEDVETLVAWAKELGQIRDGLDQRVRGQLSQLSIDAVRSTDHWSNTGDK